MFNLLSRVVITVVLISGAAFGQYRKETVSHTPPNGMTCDVHGWQAATVTVIVFEPKIGGFSFGISNVFLEPHLSRRTLVYKDKTNNISHKVTPQWVWGAWVVGLGTVTYTIL